MTRTGYLIAGALAFLLAAAGVLVWTDFFDLAKQKVAASLPTASSTATASREAQLVTAMNEAAAGGGFVASFLEGDVTKWQIADGHRIERFSLDAAGPTFARLTSTTTLDKASVQWASLGLSLQMPLEFAQAANGHQIEVGLVARSSQSNGSSDVTVVYATQQAGNSGWQTIQLKPSFEAFKFTYDVPKVEQGYVNGPILVFHSDASGGGRSVELIGAYVKVVH